MLRARVSEDTVIVQDNPPKLLQFIYAIPPVAYNDCLAIAFFLITENTHFVTIIFYCHVFSLVPQTINPVR